MQLTDNLEVNFRSGVNGEQLLERLLQHQLYVMAEKCEFHQMTVSFLRFVISYGQIKMEKIWSTWW